MQFEIKNNKLFPKSLYEDYLKKGSSINLWKKDLPLLRIEMKFASKKTQKDVLKNRFIVNFKNKSLYFGPVESQIAYKRHIAKSQKDIEDARHLEIVFKNLDLNKIEKYKKAFEEEFYNG